MTSRAHALAASVAVLFLSSPAVARTTPAQDPAATPTPTPMRMGPPGGGMGPARTLAEVPAWTDRLFGRLDANQDAAITGDELAVLTRGPAGAMGGGRLRTMIAQSDTSGDGRITREELGVGTERMFVRMDANGDGQLSDDEMPRPPAPPRAPSIPMPAPEPMPMPDMPGGSA
ncbi:EF-hand domain-containing protein [Brevundimonas sp.]|uniref:EF-hand domain-containing protein n=1 Tax=Brevundimonas sp. TaxID=1871086 RepID=UPI002D47A911|nr:EF-hand domain-containing protein [Brevundimonas sp.]HYD28096.1 EF-hand domain-containing protein [Brevundimonas sp.]